MAERLCSADHRDRAYAMKHHTASTSPCWLNGFAVRIGSLGWMKTIRFRDHDTSSWTAPLQWQEGIRTTRDMLVRYVRAINVSGALKGYRNGHRHRQLVGHLMVFAGSVSQIAPASVCLTALACRVGFSDPVSLTFCLLCCLSSQPHRPAIIARITYLANRHPTDAPVFQFRTAGRLLFQAARSASTR